jgi:hypothetical protein
MALFSPPQIYTCGPCPVAGIKHGEVLQAYDAAFVFAEVNADVVYWQQNKHGNFEISSVKKRT